ncbi:MAG TPA: hypothetical protein VKB49_09430 [Candidatus Sulfotelmatobacter sp.]|nr:hypothetical protein [Candidatus Sulfotelmatobacter sp.]
MKVWLLLVVVLASLSLLCIELPEWAGIYDDVSNDFIVGHVIDRQHREAVQNRSARLEKYALN